MRRRQLLLVDSNRRSEGARATKPMSLGAMLSAAAARLGARTALVCRDQQFTYLDVNSAANCIATGLKTAGVHEGDRVCICGPNSFEWVATYYAIAKLGAIAVPVHAKLTPRELGAIVQDCSARALVASEATLRAIQGVDQLSTLDVLSALDGQEGGEFTSVRFWIEECAPCAAREIDDTKVAAICYTSGTTGLPRGAVLTHRAIVLNAAMTAQMHFRSAEDRVLTALQCSHVYGCMVMNASFLMGGALILEGSFDPKHFLQMIERERATVIDAVPATYLSLLISSGAKDTDFSSLRLATVGGQAMADCKMAEIEDLIGCPLVQLWGMTEIAGVGATHPLHAIGAHSSIGVPLPYAELRIASLDDRSKSAHRGEVGELMVRGPTRMLSYYRNESATRECIDDEGWLATGDLARCDDEGRYYIVDRKKDMIIAGGYKIYPAELERVISAHPAVAAVAVGRVPDPIKGEAAKAYVVLRPEASLTRDELLDFSRARLAPFKIPRHIDFVASLPLTSTGKVLRRELNRLDQWASRANFDEHVRLKTRHMRDDSKQE